MKVLGGVKIQLHSSLISTPGWHEWPASCDGLCIAG
jgi:hypothetical protein